MAITLPLPLRVAAGIVATGIHVVRTLPEEIPAIPVAVVGHAMRLSMKVQQEITTLATRGDELLGGLVGRRPEEHPSWATFDEDTPTARQRAARVATEKPPATRPAARPGEESVGRAATAPPTPPPTPTRPDTETTAPTPTPDASNAPGAPVEAAERQVEAPVEPEPRTGSQAQESSVPTTPTESEPERADDEPQARDEPGPDEPVADGLVAEVLASGDMAPEPAPAGEAGSADKPAASATLRATDGSAARDQGRTADGSAPRDQGRTADGSAPPDQGRTTDGSPARDGEHPDEPSAGGVADGPAALPGYDRMTLAQVRGHLRDLSAADVSSLLSYEQAGTNRAPFLTLLSNRLVTLDAQNS